MFSNWGIGSSPKEQNLEENRGNVERVTPATEEERIGPVSWWKMSLSGSFVFKWTNNDVPFSKLLTKMFPWQSHKAVAITFPAEGMDSAFFGVDSGLATYPLFGLLSGLKYVTMYPCFVHGDDGTTKVLFLRNHSLIQMNTNPWVVIQYSWKLVWVPRTDTDNENNAVCAIFMSLHRLFKPTLHIHIHLCYSIQIEINIVVSRKDSCNKKKVKTLSKLKKNTIVSVNYSNNWSYCFVFNNYSFQKFVKFLGNPRHNILQRDFLKWIYIQYFLK